MMSYLEKNKKLIILAVIFFLVQIPFLDQLSLLRGERDIMLSGYSLAKTGRDLYGHFLPLEFFGIDPFVPFIPIYVAALWWLIIPIKTVFLARLLFVLLSVSLPFLINEIVKHITKNEKLSLLTALIFCFSPGIFHLTRLTLEIGVALPLLLLGILCYLKNKKIIAYFFFILTFFSYYGFRPLIPVLLIYLELFNYFQTKKIRGLIKNSVLSLLFFLLITGVGILVDGRLMQNRINDVAFSGFGKWSNQVIYERNTSQAPKEIAALFNNKLIDMVQYMRDVFINGIDLNYLFIKGDNSSLYATTFTGQFFLSLFPLFLLGLFYFGNKPNWRYFYMAGIIIVGLVPSIVNISYISYSIRSILSSVGHSFIIACGAMFLNIVLNKSKRLKRIIAFLFLFFLAVELIFFSYNYYTRRFITMSELFFESERKIAKYMIEHKKPYKIYTHVPRDVFFSYLFFNNKVDVKTAQKIAAKGKPYNIDGFQIIECPVNPSYLHRNEIIMDTCLSEKAYIQYIGEKKYNDKIDYTNYSFKTAYFIFN